MGNRVRLIGPAAALIAGPLVLYLGSKIVPRDARDAHPASVSGNTHPANRLGNIGENGEHEAKILAEALRKRPNHTPVLFRLAQMSEEAGNRPEAARRLREILSYEPHNSEARLELGRVLFEMGDVQGALEQTTKILTREPSHADALYNVGAIYANLGNAQRAREYWGRLLASAPRSASAERAKRMLNQLPPESL